MTLEDRTLLKTLSRINAEIINSGQARTCPACPNGDMRLRPAVWVERSRAESLAKQGLLRATEKGWRVAEGALTAYAPANTRKAEPHPLTSLTRSRAGRRPYLSRAEIRAARRFMRDFTLAVTGQTTTQTYGGSGVHTPRSADTQQTLMAMRVDADRRMQAALAQVTKSRHRLFNAVLGAGMSLKDFERRDGWPKNSARAALKAELAVLARHYEGEKE